MSDTDEVARRLVHASGAVVPIAYLADLVPWEVVQYFLIACSVGAAVLETVRLLIGLDWVIFEKLTREYEQDYLAGYALYLFSATVVVLVFDPKFAVPGLLMLTLGDPVSGLTSSGELRSVKRWNVLALMFGTCLVLAMVAKVVAFPDLPLSAVVAAAAAATVADGVKPVVFTYVIDDNLTIPIAAALAGYLAARYVPDAATVVVGL